MRDNFNIRVIPLPHENQVYPFGYDTITQSFDSKTIIGVKLVSDE